MSQDVVWYGYLDAGAKSSPVLLDNRLNTGNPKTMYLFNLARNAILEYNREVVEPKLRELGPNEEGVIEEMKAAYGEARRNFRPRGAKVVTIPEKGRAPRKAAAEESDEIEDYTDKGDRDTGDTDDWEEEED